jgi:WD40 repeat protein
VSVALVVAIALTIVALLQRQQAVDNQEQATSGELSAESLLQLNTDPQLSLLLAAQAAKTSQTAAALDALRRALPANHLVRTFQGDDRPLLGAQLAPDGSLLLTESADGYARLWNVASGRLLRTFPTINYNAGQGAMFDSKGRELLIWFLGKVQIWNLADPSAAPVTIRSPTFGQLETAVLSPDDSLVATASGPGADGASAVWNAHTGGLVRFLSAGVNNGGVIAFSPNSRLVATGSSNEGVASIWDARTGQLRHTLNASVGQSVSLQEVPSVSFSADGTRLLVSAGFPPFSNPGGSPPPEESQIWNVADGRRLAQVNGGDPIWSRGGGYIATTSSDGTARVWSASGTLISQLKSTYPTTGQAVFSPDVFNQDTRSYQIDRVATGSAVGFGAIWNAVSGVQTATFAGDTGDVNPVAFMPSGAQLVTYSSDGAARLWDTGNAPTTKIPQPAIPKGANVPGPSDIQPVDFAAPVEAITSGDPARLLILNARTGAAVATLPASAGHYYDDVSFDAQGRVMLVATSHVASGGDQTLPAELRLVHGGALLHALPGSDGRSDQGIISPNGELAATVGRSDSIAVWDVKSGRRVAEFDGHVGHKVGSVPSPVALTFSPDSRLLLSSDSSGATFVWDPRTGRTLQAIHGPPEPPTGMYSGWGGVISPNDQLVATYASWDGTVHMYRIGKPSQLIGLQGLDSGIVGAAFSPDSTLLATIADGDVDLWDTRAQSPVQTIFGGFGDAIEFATDGQSILVGGANYPNQSISCVVCGGFPRLLAAAKARETRGFTPQERALYLGG